MVWGKFGHAVVRIPYDAARLEQLFVSVADAVHSMFGVELPPGEQVRASLA